MSASAGPDCRPTTQLQNVGLSWLSFYKMEIVVLHCWLKSSAETFLSTMLMSRTEGEQPTQVRMTGQHQLLALRLHLWLVPCSTFGSLFKSLPHKFPPDYKSVTRLRVTLVRVIINNIGYDSHGLSGSSVVL